MIVFMSVILCFLFMGLSVKAAIPIIKSAGTPITVPTYLVNDTIVITGDSLEVADWSVLKDLLKDYHLDTKIANKQIPDGAFTKSRIQSVSFPEVTSIGDSAFRETKILSAIIPKAIIIGDSAFLSCYKLTSIDFPEVTSIGDYGFCFCNALVSVTFPNAITIEKNAFASMDNLISASFPKAISLDAGAFISCENLEYIYLPELTSILGGWCFSQCKSLTAAKFPKLTSTKISTFVGCISLTTDSVFMPKLTDLGSSSFYDCKSIISITEANLPEATLLNAFSFERCSTLVDVSLPKVTFVGQNCFSKCPALESVSFPEATTVYNLAFDTCYNLVSAYLPKVASIGSNAFRDCEDLLVMVLPNTSPSVAASAFTGVPSLLLIVPDTNTYTSTVLSRYPTGTEAFNKTVTIESDTIIPGTPYALKPNRIPTLTGGNYQWYKDGIPISGATGTAYQATGAGNYTLRYYRGGEWVELLAKHLVSDAIDLYGVYWRYQDCENILRLSFLPSTADREVEVWSEGDGAAYLFDVRTGKYFKDKLTYKLAANDSIVTIRYMVDENVANGSEADLFYQISGGAVTKAEKLTLYATPEIKLIQYHPTTVQYDGVLDISIEKGPSHILRSLNGGLTWQFARDTVTGEVIPFTKSEINYFIPGSTILFRMPNACRMETLTVGEGGEVPPLVTRQVTMPSVADAISTVAPGQHYVLSGTNFEFTLTPTGNNIGKALHVTTSRTTIPDSEGVTIVDNRDGSFTVTILNIKESVVISVGFATGTETINDYAVWSQANRLYIRSGISGKASVYTVSGTLIQIIDVEAGEDVSVSLSSGLHVVTLNGSVYKVLVK